MSSRFPFEFNTLMSAGIAGSLAAVLLFSATGGLAGAGGFSVAAFPLLGAREASEGAGTTVNLGGCDGTGVLLFGALPSRMRDVTRSNRDWAVFDASSTRSPSISM